MLLKKILPKPPLWPTWTPRDWFYILPESTKRSHKTGNISFQTSAQDSGSLKRVNKGAI